MNRCDWIHSFRPSRISREGAIPCRAYDQRYVLNQVSSVRKYLFRETPVGSPNRKKHSGLPFHSVDGRQSTFRICSIEYHRRGWRSDSAVEVVLFGTRMLVSGELYRISIRCRLIWFKEYPNQWDSITSLRNDGQPIQTQLRIRHIVYIYIFIITITFIIS